MTGVDLVALRRLAEQKGETSFRCIALTPAEALALVTAAEALPDTIDEADRLIRRYVPMNEAERWLEVMDAARAAVEALRGEPEGPKIGTNWAANREA